MIQLFENNPKIHVRPAEYLRLLGFPRDHVLDGRALELANWARDWYAKHGRPWVYAREARNLRIIEDSVLIEGESFSSPRLRKRLVDANARGVVLAAISAGPEAEAEAHKSWLDEKPDEYFFLEAYASAVVEHLTMHIGARICAAAETRGATALPHYSPGYQQWDIAQQPRLLELILPDAGTLPSEIHAMESGMLRPKKSLLAVFGLTNDASRTVAFTDWMPCRNCSLSRCPYRRAPRKELNHA